jgi:hypothetical protein
MYKDEDIICRYQCLNHPRGYRDARFVHINFDFWAEEGKVAFCPLCGARLHLAFCTGYRHLKEHAEIGDIEFCDRQYTEDQYQLFSSNGDSAALRANVNRVLLDGEKRKKWEEFKIIKFHL